MKFLIHSIIKLGITVLITLIILINIKKDEKFKDRFYNEVFEKNFNFAQVNSIYQDYFGSSFPFKGIIDTKPVFNEKLSYNNKEKYLDGVNLSVGDDYLVPVIKGGLVVFIGEKEGYGTVVVIEQVDGIDCWYGNIDMVNVKLYDYVETGNLLGSANKNLYLVYKMGGKAVPYEDYL
jgi:Membrane-bound metallopeptidase